MARHPAVDAPNGKGSARTIAGARAQHGPFPVQERRFGRRATSQGSIADGTDQMSLTKARASPKTHPVVKAPFFSETPSFISIAQKAGIPQRCPNQRPFQWQSRAEKRSSFS